jgi:8-oxo-dGTP pyrophosphatase MutT (NUDIX family)
MLASVLIPLFINEGDWRILLTLRTDQVEHHKGQISFPGGRLDPGEDLLKCALRETHEEVGIDPESVQILGALDDIVTVTNYRVTPFVGATEYPQRFRVSAVEIAQLLMPAIVDLLKPGVFSEERKVKLEDGRDHVTPGYKWRDHIIWGATARILYQFLEVCA